MGLPRKRNYAGRWDVLIDKSTKCLNRLLEIASKKKRNYILDQVCIPFALRPQILVRTSTTCYCETDAVIVTCCFASSWLWYAYCNWTSQEDVLCIFLIGLYRLLEKTMYWRHQVLFVYTLWTMWSLSIHVSTHDWMLWLFSRLVKY